MGKKTLATLWSHCLKSHLTGRFRKWYHYHCSLICPFGSYESITTSYWSAISHHIHLPTWIMTSTMTCAATDGDKDKYCDQPREHWLPSVALSQRQGVRPFWWGEDLDLWRTRNGGLTKTGGATLCCRGKSWDLYVSMVKLCAIALSPFEPCLYGQKCSWFQVDCSVGNFSPATGIILWSIEETTARNIIYIYI